MAVLLLTFASIIRGHLIKRKKLHKVNSSQAHEDANFLDLILMGRQLTLPLFIATLVATWYGGIFGVTEIAFNHGIYNFLTQGVFWYIAYLVFAFFLINRIARFKSLTLPHMVGQMFGPKSSYLSAIFNFVNVLPIAYIISLGLFIQILFGGELFFTMLIGIVLVVGYSLLGGFRAVVYSDLIQFFIMCLGVSLALIFSVTTFGGLSFLTANLPSTHFTLTSDQGIWSTLAWGLIALSTLVDPNFYQRCFAAKNAIIAKRGIIISTIIWFCFDLCTTFGAMYARAVIPEAESSHAYLTYVLQIMPSGLRGFFLAGILATILSTLDSYVFIAGTTLSHDLVPTKYKRKPFLFHSGIVLVGLIGLICAHFFQGDIKSVWKTLGSYSAACMLTPIMFGHIFPGRLSDHQFLLICSSSALVVTWIQFFSSLPIISTIGPLYLGILTSLLSIGLCILYNHLYNDFSKNENKNI